MKNCPICEIELQSLVPDFCEDCGWELKNDLTLFPVLDLPESAIEDYKMRAGIAKRNWMKILTIDELSRTLKKLEQRIRYIEERLESIEDTQTPIPNRLSSEKDITDKAETQNLRIDPEQSAMAGLNKDPFETLEEFERRIIAHPPFRAGKAELVKNAYDIETSRFPVKITLDIELNTVAGINVACARAFIVAKRETARMLWESGPTHPVFVALEAENGRAKVRGIWFVCQDRKFEVFGFVSEIPGSNWVEPATGMEFVFVPGGTFKMGDVFGDGGSNEKPAHTVRLDPYYIGKYPVTQGQWKKVTGCNPSRFKNGDDCPVESVSWNEAKEFILKLSKMNKDMFVFSLPTEAQWEYAARNGGKRERYAGGEDVFAVAWYDGNSKGSTHPVGSKKPNGLGIYDMSGNVWEWCEDMYDDGAYNKHQAENPVCLTGAGKGGARAVLGGAWSYRSSYVRCAYRFHCSPDHRGGDLGFRLVGI